MTASSAHSRAVPRAAVLISTVLLGLATVWGAPRVGVAAARWANTAPVRARTVALERGLPVGARAASAPVRTVDPGARFDMVGLLCDELPRGAGRLTVSLRASADGSTWGPWVDLDLQTQRTTGGARDGPDGGARGPQAYTDPVWVGPARVLQVRVGAAGAASRSVRALEAVRVMVLDTSGASTAGDRLVAVLRRAVASVAGLGAPAAQAMTSRPAIVTRAEWGADETWRSGSPLYAPVQMAFVHHTVNANSYTRAQAAGIVRGIYYYHAKGLHWSDIGYNFLVDRYGTVYEGRYGGVTRGVIGAQVLGFNTGSTGVATIGTFTSTTPPAAMMSALKALLAWKLDAHHVDPQGSARMVCRTTQKFTEGETVVFPTIAGHRQANYTACPGDALYRLLPGVRRSVAGMGLPKIYDVVVSATDISPNGDGVQEATRVRCRVSASADWAVEVRDASGALVRRVVGTGDSVDVRWDGRDETGAVVPDGIYTVTARAATGDGAARPATATVRVDTVAPTAASLAAMPEVFSPNGDGYADRCRLTFTPSEACAARVLVVNEAGETLRRLWGWSAVTAAARSVSWDGTVTGNSGLVPAADGPALLCLEVKDAAGNKATRRVAVRVDRTFAFAGVVPPAFSPNGDGVKDTAALRLSLTRRAAVTLEVLRAGTPVRRLDAGTLAAGEQSVVWDGLMADGSRASSGVYRVRAMAVSTLGEVTAARWVSVDTYRPRLSAPSRVAVALGRRARVPFTVTDPYSTTVRVTATVRDRAGLVVARIDCGRITVGTTATVSWKPPATAHGRCAAFRMPRGRAASGSAAAGSSPCAPHRRSRSAARRR